MQYLSDIFSLDSVIKMINFDISLNERKLFDHIFTGLFTLDSKKSWLIVQ